jgi:hypothetical protein
MSVNSFLIIDVILASRLLSYISQELLRGLFFLRANLFFLRKEEFNS